jgi:arsenate reductase-like glutaredoxin family protein|tara:strand:- start:138 stop:257 length:120 start_codon:yes stop_codon:yes gene_type:complete
MENNYREKEMIDVEIIKAMVINPKLIERPIVIKDKTGIV